MSQGYYGLGLALGLPFQSTMGIGNSPMIATQYANITGDIETYQRSYTYRMRALGWTDEYQWSTLMVWIANDFSFPGALIVLYFLAAIFGASWRDAVLARDDYAAVVFILFVDLFLYLPANNQLGQSLDTLFTTLFWVSIWQYRKKAKGRTT